MLEVRTFIIVVTCNIWLARDSAPDTNSNLKRKEIEGKEGREGGRKGGRKGGKVEGRKGGKEEGRKGGTKEGRGGRRKGGREGGITQLDSVN